MNLNIDIDKLTDTDIKKILTIVRSRENSIHLKNKKKTELDRKKLIDKKKKLNLY